MTASREESVSSDNANLPQIRLRGVQLHAITESQCVSHILDQLQQGCGGWVVTPNLDILRQLVRDKQLASLCSGASVMVADGMPLVWASRILGTPLPERVAGSNLISSLSSAAAQAGRSIYLMGGAEGSAEAAAEVLTQRDPNLRIAGTCCPQIGFDQDPEQLDRLAETVAASNADIVYVALGCPKQERVIVAMRDILPHSWWLGVGISFSFLCGEVRRAPRWVQRIGMEWVHRLWQEPARLAKRYLIDDIPFAIALLGAATWQRARGALRPLLRS